MWLRAKPSAELRLRQTGGTELAPLSTTPDMAVAARFSTSHHALLFVVSTSSFMQRGASLDFLSCLPQERECTASRIEPTSYGSPPNVRSTSVSCLVVEVTPHMGS